MQFRKTIKTQARQALQGSWGPARGLLLIMLGIFLCIHLLDAVVMGLLDYKFSYSGLQSFAYSQDFFYKPAATLVSLGSWVVTLLLVAPLGVGMLHWYLELTDRRRQSVMELFSPYESRGWVRAAWLSLIVSIRVGIVMVLALLPSTILFWQTEVYTWTNSLYTSLWLLGCLLLVPAFLFIWWFSKRYDMAVLLLGDRYHLTTKEALRWSVRCSKGHRGELMRLELSFLPWFIPTIVVTVLLGWSMGDSYSALPLLLTWAVMLLLVITVFKVQPYFVMSQTMYLRYLYECGQQQEQDVAADRIQWEQEPTEPAPEDSGETVHWNNIE